ALALANESGDLYARALALTIQANHAWRRGELAGARAGLETCLAMTRRLAEPFLLGLVSQYLADVVTDQDDPAAGSYLAQALATVRAAGAGRHGPTETLPLAGLHALLAGQPEAAVAHVVEGLKLVEEIG